jgi:hypothetical protein
MPDYLSPKRKQAGYDAANKDAAEFSGRISELCKYVWAGALAIFYALVTAEPKSAAFTGDQRLLLFIAAIAGSLAFLFDYLQNVTAYRHASKLADWLLNSSGAIPFKAYEKRLNDFWAQANTFFFVVKNFSVLVAAALVAGVIIIGFFK